MNYFDLTETEAYSKLCAYYRKRPELKKLLISEAVERHCHGGFVKLK